MASKTKAATLDDLPVEMIYELLRRLSLADLVRLKMTAKRYEQLVTDFRVKRLIVGCDKTNNSIDDCHPNLFTLQVAQPTLSQLRQLTINAYPEHFDLNEVNCLTRLTQLKIAYESPEGHEIRLELPELNQLEVASYETSELIVNSAKLEKLTYYGNECLLQIERPETVLSLDSNLSGELLWSFRNVRHLRSSSTLAILDEHALSNFPHLKEVAYTGTLDDVWDQGDAHDLSSYLDRFMTKKKVLGRADLKVQFALLELVDHKPIKDYKFDEFYEDYPDGSYTFLNNLCSLKWLRLHAHNYDQLIDTYPLQRARYFDIMEVFHQRIPADLFSKFVGIESVEANCCDVNEDHLLWFLQSVPELKKFTSTIKTLSESFFRRLAESCSGSLQFMSLALDELERLRDLDFAREFEALDTLELKYLNLSSVEIRMLLNMSWSRKKQFDLRIVHLDSENKKWIKFGVMKPLDSEEVVLYRCEPHRPGDHTKQRRLKTCSLACIDELAEDFEYLQTDGDPMNF